METPPPAPAPADRPRQRRGLKRVFFFLVTLLALEALGIAVVLSSRLPVWLAPHETACLCGLTGGIGGIVYCLRGMYLNACVRDTWDTGWLPWYFIRPIVSLICGFLSFLLLKAGLLVLDSTPRSESNHLGFYVLAFIAGLNVDKFVTKIEEVAQTTWGIEKSRASTRDDKAS
jgi:hypothetical protein